MRLSRIVLLIVATVVCLGIVLAIAAFALDPAAIITCSGSSPCRGNAGSDLMDGTASEDVMYGGGGNDIINTLIGDEPPSGEDKVYGGEGNDLIVATDTSPDVIDCGGGDNDKVFFDVGGMDRVAKNCEIRNPPSS
jgi:RTX calcium-binding nonapeptide repeat (4 copies)